MNLNLTLKQLTTLIEGSSGEARTIALGIARDYLNYRPVRHIAEDDWVTVNDVKVQKLFYVARTIDNFDHPRFAEAATSASRTPHCLCSVRNYELLDLLGVNGLLPNVERDCVRPCRHILTSDGEIVPLPRDIDYTSQVLNDSEGIYDDAPMPVPFSRQQVLDCFDRWFTKNVQDSDYVRLLDFLGCHDLIGTIKNVCLTHEDWKRVLTFKPCFEQHLSGYAFHDDGSLVRRDKDGYRNTIWKDDKGFHFKFRGKEDFNIVYTASQMGTVAEVYTHHCDEHMISYSESVVTDTPSWPLSKRVENMVVDSCRRLSTLYKIGVDVHLHEDRTVYTRSGVPNQLRLMNFEHRDGSRRNFLVTPHEVECDAWWVTPM